MNRRARLLIGLGSLVTFVALWDASAYFGWSDADLFPPLEKILRRAFELGVDKEFIERDLWGSMFRLICAAAMAIPVAISSGLCAGAFPRVQAAIVPFVNFTLPLPKVAIFPLMLAVFGLGDLGKVALIGIGLFYPLFINVLHGTQRLSSGEVLDLTRLYGIHGAALWYRVYWRGLTTEILVGLKASLGYGFTLVIVSELSASNNGLGNFIWRSWDAFQILDMYAAVFWLCTLGWIVQSSLDKALERHLRLNPART